MRASRLTLILGLLALAALVASAAAPPTAALPGQYALTHETEREKIKNDGFRIYSDIGILSEKPDTLEVALEGTDAAKLTYGFIELGVPKDPLYLAMQKSKDQSVEALYVDANRDNKLTVEERIELKKESSYTQMEYEWQFTLALKPFVCNVNYDCADGGIITRPIALQVHFLHNKPLKPNSSSDRHLAPLIPMYSVDSWFMGTARFNGGKGEADLAFAVLDGNDNGVFNEFGRDILIVDRDGDGYFDLAKEAAPLREFNEIAGRRQERDPTPDRALRLARPDSDPAGQGAG